MKTCLHLIFILSTIVFFQSCLVVKHNDFTKRKYLHLKVDKNNKTNDNEVLNYDVPTLPMLPSQSEVNFENNVSTNPLNVNDTAKIAEGIRKGFTFYLVCDKQKYLLDDLRFEDILSAKLIPFDNDLWRYDPVVVVFTDKCPKVNDTCLTLHRHEIKQVDYWKNNLKPGSMFVYKSGRIDQYKDETSSTNEVVLEDTLIEQPEIIPYKTKNDTTAINNSTNLDDAQKVGNYAKRIFLYSLIGLVAIIASVPAAFMSIIFWIAVVGVAVVFLTWAFILSIKGIKAGKKVPKEKRSSNFKGALFYCWTFFVFGILFYLLGLFGLITSL